MGVLEDLQSQIGSTGPLHHPSGHARISELLQVYGVDPLTVAAQTGTSLRMIERTYFKLIRSAMLEKLANLEGKLAAEDAAMTAEVSSFPGREAPTKGARKLRPLGHLRNAGASSRTVLPRKSWQSGCFFEPQQRSR
jgi:hypothetical protein